MRVLIVRAHPEPRSFTMALADRAATTLRAKGHEVEQSDLYAMNFDPVAKAEDFGCRRDPDYLVYALEQRHGYQTGSLAPDIAAEVEKLLRAELLILCFPVFWFSLPAMMKGWIDRVFLSGPIYGGRRFYAQGGLAGRKAWPVMTIGSRAHMLADEAAVHGAFDVMFRPLLRGTLAYAGLAVIEPFIAWHAPYVDAATREQMLARLQGLAERVERLPATPPPSLSGFDRQMRPV